MNPLNWSSSTSTYATPVDEVLTVDKINEMMKLVKSLPPEPFEQQMVEAGMPPSEGYELYLPIHVEQHFPNVPNYVTFSRSVSEPTIVKSLQYRTPKYDYTNS